MPRVEASWQRLCNPMYSDKFDASSLVAQSQRSMLEILSLSPSNLLDDISLGHLLCYRCYVDNVALRAPYYKYKPRLPSTLILSSSNSSNVYIIEIYSETYNEGSSYCTWGMLYMSIATLWQFASYPALRRERAVEAWCHLGASREPSDGAPQLHSQRPVTSALGLAIPPVPPQPLQAHPVVSLPARD